ncbi:hypothetical protein SBOR_0314 [Sclerotinia borealis F-4128]|uniref:Uncharacterized protein n=1 Tax=Sclerotinia borealis (strain F-4128) TaxID=1432307 RepID=W9CT16_SCLBF|nr:hypothetical protein SBOR_0314 [Sclerotinia borealis F-4128]
MVNLKIHWKGRPHRTFPRIETISSRPQTDLTPCASHANRGTCGIHNCRALEQARRKQKIEARNRSSKTSKVSTVTRSKRRASKQAIQEVFGRESPCSNTTRQDQESDIYFPLVETIVESKPYHSGKIIHETPHIHSVDGAACSIPNRIKTCLTNKNKKSQKGTRVNSINSRQLAGGSVGQARRYQANPETTVTQSSRVQDSRALYKKYNPSIRTGFASPARSKAFLAASTLASLYEEQGANSRKITQSGAPISGDPSKKEISRGGTAFIGASRLASLAQRDSFSSSVRSIVQSIASNPSSRSPSQRRALKRFTRELELYLQIVKQAPKQSPISSVPSISFSTQTIQTLHEFKPYHAEFQAAGLAVTSAEQRRQSVPYVYLHERRNTVPEVQPLPYELSGAGLLAKLEIQRRRSLSDIVEPPQDSSPDDRMGMKGSNVLTKKSVPDRVNPERELSAMSNASEETVIEWTPVYERKDPINRLDSPPCCDLAPPVMRAPSPAKSKRVDPVDPPKRTTSPAKKPLPWLRKPQNIAGSPSVLDKPTKNNRMSNLAGDATASPPYSDFTSQVNSQSSSIVLHLDTPPEHKRYIPTQISQNPTSITSATTPVPPTTTPYPQSFTGPGEGDNIDMGDFASLEQLPNQTRAAPTNGDTIAQKDTRLLKNHATQTSPAPSFITRAPHFTTQIPVTVQSQQRRGLILKSSIIGETQRRQTPPKAKAVNTPEPAPPHQISRAASTMAASCDPPSPLCCTQCNVELNTIPSLKVHPKKASAPGPSVGFESNSKMNNINTCEIPETVHCAGCKLSTANTDTDTTTVASQSSKRYVQRDIHSHEYGDIRKPDTGSREERKNLDVSADEGHYARQSDVRPCEGKARSEKISTPLPDPTKKRLIPERVLPSQSSTTSIPVPIQATESNQSTRPGYVQGQVLAYAKLPDIPILLDINPKLSVSESVGDLQNQLASLERQTRQERDTKKLFKGLRVATAAACEEGVDTFIEEITGYKVRKMLMDLGALDGLGVNTLANVARQTAKKRRGDLRRLQMTPITKVEGREGNFERGLGFRDGDGDGTWKDGLEEVARMIEKERGKLPRSQSGEKRKNIRSAEKPSRDRALGLVAGDQGVRMREEAEAMFYEASARED